MRKSLSTFLAAVITCTLSVSGFCISSTTPEVVIDGTSDVDWPVENEPFYTDGSFTVSNSGSSETVYFISDYWMNSAYAPMYGTPFRWYQRAEDSGVAPNGNSFHEMTTVGYWSTVIHSAVIGNNEVWSVSWVEDSALNVISSTAESNHLQVLFH
jgi:hypothetical protein